MANIRISAPPVDEEGQVTGPVFAEEIAQEVPRLTDEEVRDRIIADQERWRQTERHAALDVTPNLEFTIMAEKSKEQIEKESVNTGGARFEEAAEAEKAKAEVPNAVTAHAGITKVQEGEVTRLIPSAELYVTPTDELEGMEIEDPTVTGPGVRTGNALVMDEAELSLNTPASGDAYSSQHATGTSDPTTGRKAQADGSLEQAGKDRPSEKDLEGQEKKAEQVAKQAQKEQEKAAKEQEKAAK